MRACIAGTRGSRGINRSCKFAPYSKQLWTRPSKTSGALRDSAILRPPRRDAPETLSQGMVRGIVPTSSPASRPGEAGRPHRGCLGAAPQSRNLNCLATSPIIAWQRPPLTSPLTSPITIPGANPGALESRFRGTPSALHRSGSMRHRRQDLPGPTGLVRAAEAGAVRRGPARGHQGPVPPRCKRATAPENLRVLPRP